MVRVCACVCAYWTLSLHLIMTHSVRVPVISCEFRLRYNNICCTLTVAVCNLMYLPHYVVVCTTPPLTGSTLHTGVLHLCVKFHTICLLLECRNCMVTLYCNYRRTAGTLYCNHTVTLYCNRTVTLYSYCNTVLCMLKGICWADATPNNQALNLN